MKKRTLFFFFFQAEDGIRDVAVTGVQTCALPISTGGTGIGFSGSSTGGGRGGSRGSGGLPGGFGFPGRPLIGAFLVAGALRPEQAPRPVFRSAATGPDARRHARRARGSPRSQYVPFDRRRTRWARAR